MNNEFNSMSGDFMNEEDNFLTDGEKENMIPKIQYEFFQVLKNCHRCDPPFKVLSYICQSLDAEVIKDKDDFEIWKDGTILFKGDYERILEDLFVYIFSEDW